MFQFRRFPSYSYGFTVWCMDLTPCGFLHSDICGSIRACRSPQLFAAYRVLLRLLMPRHPSCALISLTYLFRIMVSYRCFQQKNFFEIVFTHLFLDIYLLKKLFPLCCFVIQFSKNRSHHSAFEASWCHFSHLLVGWRGLEPPTSRLSADVLSFSFGELPLRFAER